MDTAINHFVLLDDIISGKATLLSELHSHLYFSIDELTAFDLALQKGWAQGLYSFLYIPYEFGVELVNEPLSSSATCNHQIHIFWFKQKQLLIEADINQFLSSFSTEKAGIAEPKLSINSEEYTQKINTIHEAISRGDVYQINFTSTLDFKAYGHPAALYLRLRARQEVPYAALANLPLTEQPWLLSFSPELFLDIQANALISTKPMKGTAPILNDGRDEQRAIDLQKDVKNRAENLMIVDLLRNDLSRIARLGQVKVPALFEVNRFGSVWQMTSTVEAQIPSQSSFSSLLKATFPCGSITGAPKKMSMKLIKELEQRGRGIYTGSIGLIEANSDVSDPEVLSFYGQLNVMIRSFHLSEKGEHYQASMGVGSGIVIDSKASDEYDECFWKARFVLGLQPEFAIFETMRWSDGACLLLQRHKDRLLRSAEALAYNASTKEIEQALLRLIKQLPNTGQYRLKIALEPIAASYELLESDYSVQISPELRLVAILVELDELHQEQLLLIKNTTIFQPTYLSRHKTSQRAHYDAALKEAMQYGAFDQLLFDQEGHLLEGARSNIFLKINEQWYTPSSELPILNGVMRQEVLANPADYLNAATVIEKKITRQELLEAHEVALTNALRGLLRVKLLRA